MHQLPFLFFFGKVEMFFFLFFFDFLIVKWVRRSAMIISVVCNTTKFSDPNIATLPDETVLEQRASSPEA